MKDTESAGSVVVFLTGVGSGISGGDIHALRLAHYWSREVGRKAWVLGPSSIASYSPVDMAGILKPLMGPGGFWVRNGAAYLLMTMVRAVTAGLLAPRADFAVAGSHFLPDVLSAWIHRIRFKSKLVGFVYHLISESERPPGLRSAASRLWEGLGVRLLRRWAALTFYDNPHTGQSLEAAGFLPEKLSPTQNAYDPPFEIPKREPSAQEQLVFCGRLVPRKGVSEVVGLARTLKSHQRDTTIHLLGDGPMKAMIERVKEREGLDNLHLHGFVSELDKFSRLAKAAVFIAPSYEEGWGIAAGEALLMGLPVVAYDLPAYSHFGDRILRVPVGDERAFTEVVLRLLESPDDLRKARDGTAPESLPRWRDILEREIRLIDQLDSG